ncbi:MAG: Hsp70 family protein [Actinomycetota bacterium]|nr:Hsp70 family protein [Actinomycetota bacterium]
MAGRLAVDFGTSNTVVALWDETAGEGRPLAIPDYARLFSHDGEEVPVVPSVVHYGEGDRLLVGDQVRQANVANAPGTFRWMKRYIAHRSPAKTKVGGRNVSHFEAGRDFLTAVLAFAAVEAGVGDEEVALTVPVESYEHYDDWLGEVAEAAGMARFRLIDEPSAAALGYGASVQPGYAYLLFDFGGGTLDASVVLIDDDEGKGGRPPCRVLGKAGAELGGATIDGWLFAEVLSRAGRSDADDAVRPLSRALLNECERAKERLSSHPRAEVSVQDPRTGRIVVGAELTRADFEDLLDRHDAYAVLDRTVRRALGQARERGYDEDAIAAVLMVGGSSLIPSVQRTLQRIFGRERVLLGRPLDAVARGAAAFVAGVDVYDHIHHDYAIRWLNPATGDHDYRVFLRRGTPYPSADPVARLSVKATYDGQACLGIAIFELGEGRSSFPGATFDLVFDPTGAARLTRLSPDEDERRSRFWVNEGAPTFLLADPPGTKGEDRFSVEFGVDANKRLLLTARDLRTGRLTHRDYPVVKLT